MFFHLLENPKIRKVIGYSLALLSFLLVGIVIIISEINVVFILVDGVEFSPSLILL